MEGSLNVRLNSQKLSAKLRRAKEAQRQAELAKAEHEAQRAKEAQRQAEIAKAEREAERARELQRQTELAKVAREVERAREEHVNWTWRRPPAKLNARERSSVR